MKCAVSSISSSNSYKNVSKVILPTYKGVAEIFPGHAEAFFLLKKGKIEIHFNSKEPEIFNIEEGGCSTDGEKVQIMM